MLKKHKELILGFFIGVLLFGVIPVGATVQEYILKKSPHKLVVDGQEVVNEELPILIYNGYNYLPAATFREICDRIGVEFEWAGEAQEIRISTNRRVSKEEKPKAEIANIEKDGLELTVINETEYISLRKIHEYLIDNDLDYYVQYSPELKKVQLLSKQDTILLDEIPTYVFQGLSYVEYDYFEHNILPLVK